MDSLCPDISQLIPHRGTMCLLESIERWDEDHIVCLASSHRRLDNPLRDDSGLRALCGIEYGAQAIAAHAALLGGPNGRGPEPGLLTSVRDITARVSHLDTMAGVLTIHARLLFTHGQGSIYDVTVSGEGRTLMSGQLSVMVAGHPARPAPSVSTEGAL